MYKNIFKHTNDKTICQIGYKKKIELWAGLREIHFNVKEWIFKKVKER